MYHWINQNYAPKMIKSALSVGMLDPIKQVCVHGLYMKDGRIYLYSIKGDFILAEWIRKTLGLTDRTGETTRKLGILLDIA